MSAGQIDLDRIRRDVATLASMTRESARDGELEAARWVADQLADAGLQPVVQVHRYQHSYALVHGVHEMVALAGVARGGLRGALLTAAAGVSLDAECSGRSQWLRGLLPDDVGAGVLVRIPAADDGADHRGTVVFAAHVDAANTGWVWHPRLAALGADRAHRERTMAPAMAPVTAALAAGVLGSALPRRARVARALRAGAAAVLAGAVAGVTSVGRSPTVPGASDNATGVAVLLELARRLAVAAPSGTDVVLLFPGSEEAGMGGMRAALDHPMLVESLARGPVTVVGVDTLGSGTPIVARTEGTMRDHHFDRAAIELVQRGAVESGVEVPQPWRIGGWTDPILAQLRGIPSTCLLSVGHGGYTNYHLPTDTADRVDHDSVERCARIVDGVVRVAGRA